MSGGLAASLTAAGERTGDSTQTSHRGHGSQLPNDASARRLCSCDSDKGPRRDLWHERGLSPEIGQQEERDPGWGSYADNTAVDMPTVVCLEAGSTVSSSVTSFAKQCMSSVRRVYIIAKT